MTHRKKHSAVTTTDIQPTTDNQSTSDNQSSIMRVIESAALNPDVDIEKMERLLQMQERILARQAEIEFAESMSAAQSEMPEVFRANYNEHTRSYYATYDAVNKAMKPIYTRHGFSLIFSEEVPSKPDHIRIQAIVRHKSGHSESHFIELPMDGTGPSGKKNKTDIHAAASAITYGRRYLAMMIFNVSAGDDEDGNMPDATITEEQRQVLAGLIEEHGVDLARFLRYANVEHLIDIRAADYDKAVAAIRAKSKKREAAQ